MIQQEVQDSLIPNSFLLVTAVARCALHDAMNGEATAQDWLDMVAPQWRERYQPPPATWEINLEEPPPAICERCTQPFERVTSNQRFCSSCRVEARREAQRQSYHREKGTRNPPPAAIISFPSTSFQVQKELV